MAAIAATVTSVGLKLLASAVAGTDLAQAKFIAVGTGTQATPVSATKLAAESSTSGARIAVSGIAGTNPGEVIISGTMQASDAVNVAITEVGIFGGNSATTTKDSGVLLAYALYSHTKTQNETLALSLDMTI